MFLERTSLQQLGTHCHLGLQRCQSISSGVSGTPFPPLEGANLREVAGAPACTSSLASRKQLQQFLGFRQLLPALPQRLKQGSRAADQAHLHPPRLRMDRGRLRAPEGTVPPHMYCHPDPAPQFVVEVDDSDTGWAQSYLSVAPRMASCTSVPFSADVCLRLSETTMSVTGNS